MRKIMRAHNRIIQLSLLHTLVFDVQFIAVIINMNGKSVC